MEKNNYQGKAHNFVSEKIIMMLSTQLCLKRVPLLLNLPYVYTLLITLSADI